MKASENKWIRAAIPALLLHCSIGTVYCWSIFSQEIADYIGFSKGATEWAFSFAIFFELSDPRIDLRVEDFNTYRSSFDSLY